MCHDGDGQVWHYMRRVTESDRPATVIPQHFYTGSRICWAYLVEDAPRRGAF